VIDREYIDAIKAGFTGWKDPDERYGHLPVTKPVSGVPVHIDTIGPGTTSDRPKPTAGAKGAKPDYGVAVPAPVTGWPRTEVCNGCKESAMIPAPNALCAVCRDKRGSALRHIKGPRKPKVSQLDCRHPRGFTRKNGKSLTGQQRYQCPACHATAREQKGAACRN
jgi:hypothetical protein